MKRWINASKDKRSPKHIKEEKVVEEDRPSYTSVEGAIEDMCYQVYENYYTEIVSGDFTLDKAVLEVILHLDAPDIFNLRCGRDYKRANVVKEMKKYY